MCQLPFRSCTNKTLHLRMLMKRPTLRLQLQRAKAKSVTGGDDPESQEIFGRVTYFFIC